MVKQISVVVEIQDYEDEIDFLSKIKIFIASLKRPKLVGFHTKQLKDFEKNK